MEKLELEAGVTEIAVDHHNRTVHGDVYVPEESKFPLVIFSHGYNGYKDDFKDSATFLMRNGIASITFTFCGSGGRDPSGFATTDMTLYTEREDLSALIDYAKSIRGFNGNLYLFGGSQGGMVSALTAEQRKEDIKGMVLLFPAFCIPDNWNDTFKTEEEIPEAYPFLGVNLGRNFFTSIRSLDIYAEMANFNKPVLLLHGTNDAMVPMLYSERAEQTYPQAKLIRYAGEAHGFTPTGMVNVKERLLDFIYFGLPSE